MKKIPLFWEKRCRSYVGIQKDSFMEEKNMHKLLKRIVTIMLALCLLVTTLPMAALAEDGAVSSNSNEDGATIGEQIVYSVNSYSGAYDGEAHSISLNVTTPDVQVYYATESSEYSTTLPLSLIHI